ncbi:zinc ABC transporter substrate-binding protein [Sulfitobacter sp. F26169L]|uniref:zinc ABC transporter substrate-binding protein n=1 Tax=Sulfitobacter sp. F26169L TaxID=2996015 RepID=UPI002260C23E|nr:zinc ABC transporter substrate-binding protein [Sulfitobacter sp. F26169L]MCX7565110.1 zinc ABC transporter substrate-binding protein [Sulfitobacter sp. F26169L]
MRRLFAILLLLSSPAAARAAPEVVVDIAPIRALVAQIMEGVGEPAQIIPTGSSPHDYAMRPSEARALRNADLVIWVGPALTHWLEEPLDSLAGDAGRMTLMSLPLTHKLPLREADTDAHDHSHSHEHEGDTDPHGWLSPLNAAVWAEAVAEKLAQIDPENAQIYAANWQTLRGELAALVRELDALFLPYRETPFIVLHDSFHYFEAAFDIEAQASIIPADGSSPGPARLKALRDDLAEHPVVCAFTAPQENDALLRTALAEQGTHIAVLDPMGDGEMSYATLMRRFADDMVSCLAKGTR